ncbi:MAG: hypothetical protein IJG59_09820 [Erysipelotrichaceae bacterium]|nr:hypothetical protein [Erysipelotrichaceae bacterium]
MRNKLKADSVIWFDPAENGTFKHCVKITDCIGEGGTGIIYTGIDDSGIVWVIKESFPNTENSVLNIVHVYRRDNGNISVYTDNNDYDLNTEINRILENENEVALNLQNDLTNRIMNMPFYNGILKGAAIQCPGQNVPVICNQMFTRMQYVKGITADKTEFSDTLERLRAVEDILKAIARIHQAGFILGDIKPQNIMIADGGNGRCFVLDYGSAVKTDTNGVANIDPFTYPRSSGYIGPEMFDMAEGHFYLTKAYDVYSLGALLMDLLMPQRTKTIREIQYRQRMEFHYRFLYEDMETYGVFSKLSVMQELPVSPALADQLSRILRKSMADDREERYQDAGELLEDYSRFLNNYQYKTLKPQNYNYHLFWQASYDYMAERLNDMICGQISKVNAIKAVRKTKPEWWELLPVNGYDNEDNCYPNAVSISEVLSRESVYLHGVKGSGKTVKACQIMQRKLWEMPVLYVDLGLWNNEEISDKVLSADGIINSALWEVFGYLPDRFTEMLKQNNDPFLIVMDNINNVGSVQKEAVFRAITGLQSANSKAQILLVGLSETIGNEKLDVSFRKIRLEGFDEQNNPLLRIPFFFMRYQEMKYKDPEFVLDTDSEVEFLKKYMDSLGTDYYRHENILLNIAMKMAEGVLYLRYISKKDLTALLENEYSPDELAEIIGILTDKLGLLTYVQGKDYFAFTHDIYQDYFTAGQISLLIQDAIRYDNLKVLSAVRKLDTEVVRILLSLLKPQQLDKLYCMLNDTDSEKDIFNSIGLIEGMVNYYWYCEGYTVNRWAELGVKYRDDLSMAATAADLIMKITPDNHHTLDEAVNLCRQGIAHSQSIFNKYPDYLYLESSVRNWAREYLGMLILHDVLEEKQLGCFLNRNTFSSVIISDVNELYCPECYYRIKGPLGKIDGLTVHDGIKLYYVDYIPETIKSIINDLPGEQVRLDAEMQEKSGNNAIRIRRKYWNIIKDTELNRGIMRFRDEDSYVNLEYIGAARYQEENYNVFATVDHQDSDGIEKIVIMKITQPSWKYYFMLLTGNDLSGEEEFQLQKDKIEDKSICNGVFNAFMKGGGKNNFDIIEN